MACFGRAKKQNKLIDADLKNCRRARERELQLLLLGAENSGKSTVAKQMKIIHTSGFQENEIQNIKHLIHSNLFTSIRLLINGAKTLNMKLNHINEEAASRICAADSPVMTKEYFHDIQALWDDPAIKNALQFHFIPSSSYFLNALDRLCNQDYNPTYQDILQLKHTTVGVVDVRFEFNGINFLMVDVSETKSERRKWIHFFQDVTAVLFFAALNEYDMNLEGGCDEDGVTNKMQLSLKHFSEVCNNVYFRDTAIILFLNKSDLFKEKITRVNLNICFENYDGPMDYKEGITFICQKYLAVIQSPHKIIYIYETCATDTELITVVFNAVNDIVLRQGLMHAG